MPQNHPSPKEIVSNVDGAAVSMGGSLLCVSIEVPVVFVWAAMAGSVMWTETTRMAAQTRKMKNLSGFKDFIGFITAFLVFNIFPRGRYH